MNYSRDCAFLLFESDSVMGSSVREALAVADKGSHWAITYGAMAGPCEILIRGADEKLANELASLAHTETVRIERKFSRYRADNMVHAINHSEGVPVPLDEETSKLLQYAGQCYELSEGRFDITSGVLRRAWTFDGGSISPDAAEIAILRESVGWWRVGFDGESIRLPYGMEIDLGGIVKEYAADRVAALTAESASGSVLVNFGGDIRIIAAGKDAPWTIGIEEPGPRKKAVGQIEIAQGGVATGGEAHRLCMVDGERMGDTLDPRTGWPVSGAPRSVTVIADTCSTAGFLATMAILHGPAAENFLEAQRVIYHCIR